MKKITVEINGVEYRLFEITVFKDTPNEATIIVAEERLNKKIESMIFIEQYHKVRDIDQMYGYYLPQEIADDECEFEMVDSIESVMREDLQQTKSWK